MKAARLLLCLCAFVSLGVAASEQASRASVERLMELTEVSKVIDAMQPQISGMFDGLGDQLGLTEEERPAFNAYKQKVIDLMHQEVNWEAMKEPMLDIYSKHLSQAEVDGLIAFYSSDLGQSMTRKMPLVMQEAMGASQQMIQSMMPRIEALAVEMRAEIVRQREERSGD